MAEQLQTFLMNLRALREQDSAERMARMNRLKTMTAEQFVRVPREDLQDLTNKQYAEIVSQISPEHRLPELPVASSSADSLWTGLRNMTIPIAVKALLFGLLIGLLILMGCLAIGPIIDWWRYQTPPVRSEDASTWPDCHRLDGWVDGCTYSPTQNLSWQRAASLLEIPETELRITNSHLIQYYIPAATTLIVWRHRGQLSRSTP